MVAYRTPRLTSLSAVRERLVSDKLNATEKRLLSVFSLRKSSCSVRRPDTPAIVEDEEEEGVEETEEGEEEGEKREKEEEESDGGEEDKDDTIIPA